MNTSDYPEILNSLKEIPCDQFHVNYMPYPLPHNLAREFFLEHEEYTHLIVMPQDLHVTKQHYESLIKTVQETKYDVVSGVCNVERPMHRNYHKWAICKKIPSLDKFKRYYNWMPETSQTLGVVQVEFSGFVFCCIARKVVNRIDLKSGTPIFKGTVHIGTGQFLAAPDLTFCHACKDAGIPIYADTDIRMRHYANHKDSLIGKKLSSTEFIRYQP